MIMRAHAIRILLPLYALFAFMNLFPPVPGMANMDVALILLVALTQTLGAGGLVLLIMLDPGKPADECNHG